MSQWEYSITTHTAADVLTRLSVPPQEAERVVYCDTGGRCFFDEAPNPYVSALEAILNERGREGWILVQTILRRDDMICFWRRERP